MGVKLELHAEALYVRARARSWGAIQMHAASCMIMACGRPVILKALWYLEGPDSPSVAPFSDSIIS